MATLSAAALDGRASACRLLTVLVVLAALMVLVGLPDAGAEPASWENITERQVKAAYLSKFGSYIEWPAQAFASSTSPLRIGVMGADMLADELQQIVEGRTVNGRPIAVQKLQHGDPVADLNVLFIGHANNDRLADILAATKGAPILTVTESDGALALGSMINFVVVDGKVRFEVAPKTAGMGNLNISARLLAAAYKVVPGES